MLPVGPLMIEHRLIERIIKLMDKEFQNILRSNKANIDFINVAIDFIKIYADRCHHGKEEDILFRDLTKKPLSIEHKKIMNELIKEHILARGNVKKLIEANDKYKEGNDEEALKAVVENIGILVKLYPKHIEKEDKHFFIPVMVYFSSEEKEAMLKEFWEFDKRLIHEKYGKIIDELEKKQY